MGGGAGTALAAGHLTATPHATTVDLAVTPATGGTPPITYFFERRGVFIPGPGGGTYQWDVIASGVDLLAFTDTGLMPLTTYHYRVTVVDVAQPANAATSNVVDVTTAGSDLMLGEVSLLPSLRGQLAVTGRLQGRVEVNP